MSDPDRFDTFGHLIVPGPCGACDGHGWLMGHDGSGHRNVRCPWCQPDPSDGRTVP